ncbi:hypothetical protein JZK55_08810 [Dissulfurispira thermophila]|uniref:Uncharacterized protein n=1 Tax=Dissulfurispira thermophila TaxID=2715679 RepID=A0A7G1H111_9BACT|nr:hypothetical protein [Dissulfurispira thermophila]BCB95959.1 hypothetical protein JZK55_08810 [Dissulfurispira thermophila]
MQTVEKDKYQIETFEDILNVLREKPDWREELRRIILTDDLMNLPKRFEIFIRDDFKPLQVKVDKIEQDVGVLKQDVGVLKQDVGVLKQDVGVLKQDVGVLKQDVEVLKQDVEVLKQDVEVLKQDVASLKESDFERTVREKAPAYFGRLIRRCRVISFETLADKLEDAVDISLISDKDKDNALLLDAVVSGKLKTGKDIILAVEISLKVDVEDVQRAAQRADIVSKALRTETIGVAIGKDRTQKAEVKAEELNVILI